MKFFRILLLLIALSFSFQSYSQTLSPDSIKYIKQRFEAVKDSILGEYCCHEDSCGIIKTGKKKVVRKPVQAVLGQSLDSSFQNIFNTVILNSNDIVKNGSAGAISQDDKTGKLSLNYALKLQYDKFFNIGTSVESTEGFWDLYSKNSWRNSIALNIGYTWVGNHNGQYFSPEDCSKAFDKKKAFMDSLLLEYYIILNDVVSNSKKMDVLKKILKDTFPTLETRAQNSEGYKKLIHEIDSLEKVKKEYEKLTKGNPNIPYKSILSKELIDHELKQDFFTGYNVSWWNINASFGNTQNKLYNDTLTKDSLLVFRTSDYERFRFNFNWNKVWNTKRVLSFISFGTSLFNTNFLEKKEIKDIPYIEKDAEGKKYVYANEVELGKEGPLDALKKNLWIASLNGYGSSFFIFKKTLGFEVNGEYKYRTNKIDNVDFPHTYTLYGGVIFRIDSKDLLSKATIAVDAGLFDAPVKRRGNDYFAYRLKIGVPFNTIVKK